MTSSTNDLSGLRIAFLAGILKQGGCERQLYFMAKALCEAGCRPDVFSFDQGEYWEAPLKDLGIRVVSITEKSRIARLKKLQTCINQGNYDYLHSQHFYTNLYALAVSLFRNTRCIGSIRNDAISEVNGLGIMGWLSLILPPRMVANSYLGITNAKKFGRKPENIFFLPNFVDTDIFFPDKAKKDRDYFKVITVGTVWKPKRIDRVIEIAKRLHQRTQKKTIFEIIGDGDQLDDMIKLARSKGLLNSVVFFKGRLQDVAPVYQEADTLLLTSDHEGTPNVVLEAMASGLPVVASRVGDIPNLVVDGITGFSADRNDIEKIVDGIQTLSNNKELCMTMGERARAYVLSNHSQNNLTRRLTELYDLNRHLK